MKKTLIVPFLLLSLLLVFTGCSNTDKPAEEPKEEVKKEDAAKKEAEKKEPEKKEAEQPAAKKEEQKAPVKKAKPEPPKANPALRTFMGVKWMTPFNEFKKHFNSPDKLGYAMTLPEGDVKFYSLDDFELGPVTFKSLMLSFTLDKKTKQFLFDMAHADLSPEYYETLLEIFVKKYGKPLEYKEYQIQTRMGVKYLQKHAYWADMPTLRKIIFMKYGDTISKGQLYFSPIDLNAGKKAKKKVQEGIDKL